MGILIIMMTAAAGLVLAATSALPWKVGFHAALGLLYRGPPKASRVGSSQ